VDWKTMGQARYSTWYDEATKTFRVLDIWHSSIKNIDQNAIDDNMIPDDSPAVKILSTEEVNSLMSEVKKLGWLGKYAGEEPTGIKLEHIARPPTLHEVAISKVADIAHLEMPKYNEQVCKEAISAIRNIMDKV
jgi:hypothetical protein